MSSAFKALGTVGLLFTFPCLSLERIQGVTGQVYTQATRR
jgi:hypothetical protein